MTQISKFSLYPLSETWQPPELLIREKQLGAILESIQSVPSNFWIHGERGLGKTLVARTVCQMDPNALYIPCSSSFKESMRSFALRNGVKPRSGDGAVSMVMDVLMKRSKERSAFIFFDDVDKLAGGTFRRDLGSYLHDLYDRLQSEGFSFSINVVTTFPYERVDRVLSPPAMSRLRFRPLLFPRYTKQEIAILLRQRLDYIKGLEARPEAIELIADYISRIGGDFRKALEMTRNSISDGRITVESVERAWGEERELFWKDQIANLGYHEAALLGSIVEETVWLHKSRDAEPPYFPASWDAVKGRYRKRLKELGISPQDEKMLYYWLEQLWLKGWVEKFVLSKRHEWNYAKRRCLFVRLQEKLTNLVPAMQQIDWSNPW